MNKQRRARLENICGMLEELMDQVEYIYEEELKTYNNLSDGLQCTERGTRMDEDIAALYEAHEKIEGALDVLMDMID